LTLDQALIRDLRISRQDVDAAVVRERAELERRERLYRGGRPAPLVRGRMVLLVDDGLATGSTMLAAARYVRSLGPASVKIAVAVGSEQACRWSKVSAVSASA
jgi:putative phosphoribosyl transferase